MAVLMFTMLFVLWSTSPSATFLLVVHPVLLPARELREHEQKRARAQRPDERPDHPGGHPGAVLPRRRRRRLRRGRRRRRQRRRGRAEDREHVLQHQHVKRRRLERALRQLRLQGRSPAGENFGLDVRVDLVVVRSNLRRFPRHLHAQHRPDVQIREVRIDQRAGKPPRVDVRL